MSLRLTVSAVWSACGLVTYTEVRSCCGIQWTVSKSRIDTIDIHSNSIEVDDVSKIAWAINQLRAAAMTIAISQFGDQFRELQLKRTVVSNAKDKSTLVHRASLMHRE